MPTYDYECTKCSHVFEVFHSMTASPVKRCPLCKCKVRRLLGTGSGIIFKGSGFYETDYKRKDVKAGKKSHESQTASDSSPSEKPAAAKDSASGTPTPATS